jgi:hypothetical protein
MKRITNLSGRMQCLADERGTILAAAGTSGSSKLVEAISDADLARLGDSIHVEDAVIESESPLAKHKPLAAEPGGKKES